MPQYFWANWTDIPPELITRNFSPTHLTWVAASLILVVVTAAVFRRLRPDTRRRMLRALAIALVSCEAATWIWAAAMGCYTPQDMLPLHLCGFSVWIEFAAVFLPNHTLLREFTYALSLPAALFAILTPGWFYPFFTFRYLDSVVLHTLLMLLPVLFLTGEGFRPDYRRLPKCFGLLLFFAGIAAVANTLFGGNYMFLRFAPEDTLLWVFKTWLGEPGYLLPVFGMIGILWVLMYLPWILRKRLQKRKKEPVLPT